MEYSGYKTIVLNDEELARLYSEGTYEKEKFLENEYLIVKGAQGVEDYFKFKKGKFIQVKFPSLGNEYTGVMKPRNPQQYCAMDLLRDMTIPLKLITGCFGSGKSMAMIVAGLEAVQRGDFEKIVFVRNNVQVRETDQIGSLPGDVNDKIRPYLMPFADHCGGPEGLAHLIDRGQLEVIPLGFMRGRSIRNSIIYSMESENLIKQHIQLLMGRVDEGSQLWLDGDYHHQRDRDIFEKSRGLETMIERLAGNPYFGYVHLVKSERSEVARLADLLD